ncbi:putative mediator of RNA polymerase II transcription subunit 26 isoform X2 [Halichondria panicea]|uniref:putative mediator of RNA polymerase II transcription subunit 26 isoform X2 n=1 Tax=Halichondria panicea TaxID=6063 RepID=UPI00312B2B4E
MATGGQYNIQFSDEQRYNGSYPIVRPNSNGNQYRNFSVPLSQGQYNNHPFPGIQPSNSSGHYPIASTSPRQQVPNQTTRGQWTNEGLPSQGIPGTEPFLVQDNYLKNNHTGEHSMHSEEFRLDSNEPEGIDHKQQLKPGDYEEREGQTDLAAPQHDQRSKIFSKVLATIVEPREMIIKHRSYHNEISGEEAEKRLRVFSNHHYLTRYSENKKCYILSVCASDEDLQFEKTKHFQLKLSDQGIKIQEKKRFADLEEMLNYYETNRLDTAFPRIGVCLTEDDYRARVKKIREQQAQQEREQEQRQEQAQLQQKEQGQVKLQQQQTQIMQQQMQLLQTLQQQVNANPAPQVQPKRRKCTIL